MDHTIEHTRNENTDRRKSAIITAVVSLLILLLIIFYKFTKIPDPQPEAVTTMLINFGDNRNGDQVDEPANQEGSLAASNFVPTEDPVAEPQKITSKPVLEKILTGNNTKVSTPKNVEKITKSKAEAAKNTKKTTSATKSNANNSGDGKGKNAIDRKSVV